ncbi:hypothetical protein [Flavobacterium sp. IMCC34518]|jgi:hypothetical protein|uniref:hypothetical protein n=1 Tax=Flavobacterium sp. IMCC34518 TaxID=3003623 RepID=UPI0022AC5BC4|nr:hypothetical protein [Flavobacterium sp. IMCC34518]
MESERIKSITINVSLLLFFISLTQNAVKIYYHGESQDSSSISYLLTGSIAFFGGGLLEEIIWLANPLCLYAIIMLQRKDRKAIVLSCIALLLAISFSFWTEILGSESGSLAKILSLELGYFLWLLSIITLTIGTFLFFIVEKKELIEEENSIL